MAMLGSGSGRPSASYIFSSNTSDASINVSTLPGYVANKTDISIIINSGIYVYSTNTANAALTLTGGSSGDKLTIINNGYIMGKGGKGGGWYGVQNQSPTAYPGYNGGPALSLSMATTINNTSSSAYIGGGGGGGGGGCVYIINNGLLGIYAGSGGAGGGDGGDYWSNQYNVGAYAGAIGGTIGNNGNNSVLLTSPYNRVSGSSGGRIFPSTSTTLTNSDVATPYAYTGAGSGGAAGNVIVAAAGYSGTTIGGGPAQAGSSYSSGVYVYASGSGGGYGASGSSMYKGVEWSVGGIGGKAISLNGNSVTWVNGDTTRVYGAVS